METSLALLDIQALRERGLRESAPHYKIRATKVGKRHQQFRYFMWLVCPEYLSSLSDGSIKDLEKLYPRGIEVKDKVVPKVIGHTKSKINRDFRKHASRFINEYLGIEIPAYSAVVPRFYSSIIEHGVRYSSKPTLAIQEALKDAKASYKESSFITSESSNRARYLCSLIFWGYYSGLPYENHQEFIKIS